jgi:hypothetical protein
MIILLREYTFMCFMFEGEKCVYLEKVWVVEAKFVCVGYFCLMKLIN